MGDLFAVVALGLFSANAFLVRAAADRVTQQTGFMVALVANVGFGAALLGAQVVIRGGGLEVDGRALGLFALAGIFASYLGRRGYFRTVQTIGPARAVTIQNTSPVAALVLAWVFLDETLGPVQLLLMVGVILGLCLVHGVRRGAWSPRRTTDISTEFAVPVRELGVALFAAAAYGAGNVVRGEAVDRWHEPLAGALAGAVAGTAAYAILHISPRRLVEQLREQPADGLALWAASGMFTIGGQAALIASTAYLPVAVAVAVASATPAVVIPIGVLFLGNIERLTRMSGAGAVLITGGVVALLLT